MKCHNKRPNLKMFKFYLNIVRRLNKVCKKFLNFLVIKLKNYVLYLIKLNLYVGMTYCALCLNTCYVKIFVHQLNLSIFTKYKFLQFFLQNF